ncbi:MAG: hypothetical protein ACYS17_04535 [Planctomycetota bacterium]
MIKFGARFLDFVPVLSYESTGASLEMTPEWITAYGGLRSK